MARIAALIPDVRFARDLQELLQAAGHQVQLVRDVRWIGDCELVVVDLMAESIPAEAIELLGELPVPVLGAFGHTRPDVREAALIAGVDQAVPRSRLMAEAPELVAALLAAP